MQNLTAQNLAGVAWVEDGRREALGRILAGDPVAPPSWCRG
ncbi:hypothetical protein SEA_BRYLER_83 [Mycobacterium phage Bryler]|uniref:Uncharacterized protein n=1 Tax=Mycobacterium phage Bryler TaxID=2653755 RepID=A0A5Q2WR78_9CAUD|nr:hypothetical protein I5G79_gp15 [Mycobacterium phage Bryler]QGH80458.1 hypothetical protein SEA_BRYLER_83 [Mycobacterium phage Bryler]